MADRTPAPWSTAQVVALCRWQAAGHVHPLTCPRHNVKVNLGLEQIREIDETPEVGLPSGGQPRFPFPLGDAFEALHQITGVEVNVALKARGNILLVPGHDGLRCAVDVCDYRQDWVPTLCFEVPDSPFASHDI